MNRDKRSSPPIDRLEGENQFRQSLANVQLEGMKPSPYAIDLANRIARGELNIEEAIKMVIKHHAR